MKYLKQNKLYTIVMAIGIILFAIQMNFVVLYADDLSLGTIAKTGLKGALEHLAFNYMNWGGGPTPFIAIIFLFFNLNVWKIFNIIVIALTIHLSVKMITYNNKINKGILASIFWICIYVLNIYMSNETLYWLDGNLAYVLTAFQMLLLFYYLYSRLIMNTKVRKYDIVLLPLVAFFAGWTGPQSGAIAVIISTILLLWVKFINKKKIEPIYIVSWFFAVIGFLVYYIAPGNNGRMVSAFPEFAEYGLFERIFYRVHSVWGLLFSYNTYRFASIPTYLYIVIGLIGIISIKYAKQESNKKLLLVINIMSVVILTFIILNFAMCLDTNVNEKLAVYISKFEPILERIQAGTYGISLFIPYATTGCIMLFAVILSYYISYKEKNPLLFSIFVCALLGQLMMLVAPYSPLRSTFITVVLLWIAIAYLFKSAIENKISVIWIIAAIMTIMYSLNMSIIIIATYMIFKTIYGDNEKIQYVVLAGIFMALALITYNQTLTGYKINKQIYEENMQRIEDYKQNGNEEGILYLRNPINSQYGSTPFLGIEWVEEAVKEYFELGNVILLPDEE